MDTEILQEACNISTKLLKLIRQIQDQENKKSSHLIAARAKIQEFVRINISEEQEWEYDGPFSFEELKNHLEGLE